MNYHYRNAHLLLVLLQFIVMLTSVIVGGYDVYNLLANKSSLGHTPDFKYIVGTFYSIPIILVALLLNIFATVTKRKIHESLKDEGLIFSPALLFFGFFMVYCYTKDLLTPDYFLLSTLIVVVFAVLNVKTIKHELFTTRKPKSIFSEDDFKNDQGNEAIKEVEIKEEPKLDHRIIYSLSKDDSEKFYEWTKVNDDQLLYSPYNYKYPSFFANYLLYKKPSSAIYKRMKAIQYLSYFVRAMIAAQLLLVIYYSITNDHTITFTLHNLKAPIFWVLVLTICQWAFHGSILVHTKPELMTKTITTGIALVLALHALYLSFSPDTIFYHLPVVLYVLSFGLIFQWLRMRGFYRKTMQSILDYKDEQSPS